MARRTKEDAEQTKTEILNSAMELFYEKGFARTTFDEIAKRINLTKGAVYWHFRNKTDLLAELMRRKFTEKSKKPGRIGRKSALYLSLGNIMRAVPRRLKPIPDFANFYFSSFFKWSGQSW